jgi:hypothetical protein
MRVLGVAVLTIGLLQRRNGQSGSLSQVIAGAFLSLFYLALGVRAAIFMAKEVSPLYYQPTLVLLWVS